MKLNLASNLTLDIYGAYGESENVSTQSGYYAVSRVQQSLFATNANTCANTANACVPLNIFGTTGSITPQQNAFVGGITSSITNKAQLAQAHALLSGDLGFASPAAAIRSASRSVPNIATTAHSASGQPRAGPGRTGRRRRRGPAAHRVAITSRKCSAKSSPRSSQDKPCFHR